MDENAEAVGGEAADYMALTGEIVSAYVSKNSVQAADLPDLLASVHAALSGLGRGKNTEAPVIQKLTPAQIRKSIKHDALISFEDSKPYKTLKRHLTALGLSPEAYREKWGLPRDYPMTAPSYSEMRSSLAKSVGLGQGRRKTAPKSADAAEAVSGQPKRVVRPRKAQEPAGGRQARRDHRIQCS
ncbi:MucR family transcriptional regulator [Methylobacterium sp. P31]